MNNHAEAAYRDAARAWLAEHTEPRIDDTGFHTRYWMHDAETDRSHYERCRAIRMKLYDAGYLGITLPVEIGGQGGEQWMERVFVASGCEHSGTRGKRLASGGNPSISGICRACLPLCSPLFAVGP